MASPSTERWRRWKQRQTGALPLFQPLLCAACGSPRTGKRGELCSRCWTRLTPEGRADRAERVRRARQRRNINP